MSEFLHRILWNIVENRMDETVNRLRKTLVNLANAAQLCHTRSFYSFSISGCIDPKCMEEIGSYGGIRTDVI